MSTKISALATGTTANATDKIPVERTGANRYITPLMVATYLETAGLGLVAKAHTSVNVTYAAFNITNKHRINFNTVDYDRDSAITTGASWVYTAPATGKYRVDIFECFVSKNGASWAASDLIEWYLYKNAATYISTMESFIWQAVSAFSYHVSSGFGYVDLTAAETCHVKFQNGSAASQIRQIDTPATVTISRVR